MMIIPDKVCDIIEVNSLLGKEVMAKKIKVAKLNRNNNHRHSVKRGRKMLKYLKNV